MKRWIPVACILILVSCNKDKNEKPIASFSVNPAIGDNYTNFEFNGDGTTDPDGPDSLLQYRWDWESDGIYDQLYDRNPSITQDFNIPGEYQVTLQVKDIGGQTATTSQMIQVERGSRAPLDPFTPNPKDSSNNILFKGKLSWVAVDPDKDQMHYDIYLGNQMDPPLWKKDHDTTFIELAHIQPGIKYYWRIVIRDTTGLITEGPTWRFSIHSGYYERDTLTDERDGTKYPLIKINNVWWMTENLRYDYPERSRCLHDLEDNCDLYGRYYEIYSLDSLLCPDGWYLPGREVLEGLEKELGMSDQDVKRSRVWRGNDQGSQIAPGGTSELNMQYTGYLDYDGNWVSVDEAAVFGAIRQLHVPVRMIQKGYGGIMSGSFSDLQYAPVRCVKYD